MTYSLKILFGLLLTSHPLLQDISKSFVDANELQTALRKIKCHIGELIRISGWRNLISYLLTIYHFCLRTFGKVG